MADIVDISRSSKTYCIYKSELLWSWPYKHLNYDSNKFRHIIKDLYKQLCCRILQATSVERYEWSEELQGMILASFYIGYVIMHLPCAFIAQRFGGKCLLVFGLACSSVFSLLIPSAIVWGGANALIAIRIIIGSCTGGMWPAVSMIIAAWIPIKERNAVGSLVFSGLSVNIMIKLVLAIDLIDSIQMAFILQCGNISGNLIAGLLLDFYQNWHIVFYTFGTIGIVVTTVFVSSWDFGMEILEMRFRSKLFIFYGIFDSFLDAPAIPVRIHLSVKRKKLFWNKNLANWVRERSDRQHRGNQ